MNKDYFGSYKFLLMFSFYRKRRLRSIISHLGQLPSTAAVRVEMAQSLSEMGYIRDGSEYVLFLNSLEEKCNK